MPLRKILHFNFGTEHNKGDAAIIYGIQDLIHNSIANVQIDSIEIQKLKYRRFSGIAEEDVDNYKHSFKVLLMPFLWLVAVYKDWQLLHKINNYDLVVIGGGGVYSGRWLLPLKDQLIKKIKPPVVLFAPGYNRSKGEPELNEKSKQSILNLYHHSALNSVRDQKTFDLLTSLSENVLPKVIPDPAIFLEPSLMSQIKFDSDRLKIGLNLAFHGWPDQHNHKQNLIKVYSEFIEYLETQYNPQLFYLLHTNYELDNIGEDTLATQLIKTHPELTMVDANPKELKHCYSNIDFSISMMLHSNILSFSGMTPYVGIAYDRKNYAFANRIEHSPYMLDIENLTTEKLIQRFELLRKNKNLVETKFQQKLDLYKTEIADFMEEFKRVLEN